MTNLLSRRVFTQIGALSALSTLAARPACADDVTAKPFPLVVDSSVSCATAAADLARRGVKVVIRYYAREKQDNYPTKILTRGEADTLNNEKIAIGLSYQYYNGRITSFTKAEAKLAAEYCISRDLKLSKSRDRSNLIDHPTGTAIYFGVDSDFTGVSNKDWSAEQKKAQQEKNVEIIIGYFDTINETFAAAKAPFAVGVYGPGDVCRRLGTRVKHVWLPGSTGWTGTPEFYNSGRWDLYQKAVEVPTSRVPVDTNIINPKRGGKLGAFTKTGLLAPLENAAVLKNERFVNLNAPFFVQPGGARIIHDVENKPDPIEHRDYIERRKMVTVVPNELPARAGWTRVEAVFTQKKPNGEEYGMVRQGYVETKFLINVDRMPS